MTRSSEISHLYGFDIAFFHFVDPAIHNLNNFSVWLRAYPVDVLQWCTLIGQHTFTVPCLKVYQEQTPSISWRRDRIHHWFCKLLQTSCWRQNSQNKWCLQWRWVHQLPWSSNGLMDVSPAWVWDCDWWVGEGRRPNSGNSVELLALFLVSIRASWKLKYELYISVPYTEYLEFRKN